MKIRISVEIDTTSEGVLTRVLRSLSMKPFFFAWASSWFSGTGSPPTALSVSSFWA